MRETSDLDGPLSKTDLIVRIRDSRATWTQCINSEYAFACVVTSLSYNASSQAKYIPKLPMIAIVHDGYLNNEFVKLWIGTPQQKS